MRIIVAALISLCLWTGLPALAQEAETSAGLDRLAGEPVAAAAKPVVAPRPSLAAHRFFDVKNSLAILSVAVSLAGDGWSTQRALAFPGAHEMNPVARPFVSSRAGEIAYSSAGFALVTGGMYLAHRTRHHKLERIAPFALAGWEALITGWNLHQISRAPASR